MKINYIVESNLGIITLVNPPYNQLLSPIFIDPKKLQSILDDETIKGLIIKGDGRNFCAGADPQILAAQLQNPDGLSDLLDNGKKILCMINESPVPVIAAINGSCLGAGLEIAMACHFRFSSNNAMLGFPESNLNLMPGMGGSFFTKYKAQRQNLIELLISGKMINGEEAHNLGIVDEIFPIKLVEDKAKKYLINLTKNRSALLIRSIIKSIHNSENLPKDKALREETKLFINIAKSLNAEIKNGPK